LATGDLILGVDPGTRRCGFGIIRVIGDRLSHVDHGVIRLRDELPLPERLRILSVELQKIYAQFSIHTTVVEKVFFGKNADSAFKLGHARGVCLMASAFAGAQLEEYAARYVKKCVTGSGAASKDQVQLIVMATLGLKGVGPLVLDASDALALAVAHARVRDVNARMKKALENEL
jgi:crossover junction endodeoxyribonuclease RuvC